MDKMKGGTPVAATHATYASRPDVKPALLLRTLRAAGVEISAVVQDEKGWSARVAFPCPRCSDPHCATKRHLEVYEEASATQALLTVIGLSVWLAPGTFKPGLRLESRLWS